MRRLGWLAVTVLACGVSCKKETSAPETLGVGGAAASSASSALAAKPARQYPPSKRELPTTDGVIALGNLSSQVHGAESDVEKHPTDVDVRNQLVELLSTRARFTGSLSDLFRAADLGEEAVKRAPDNGRAYALRARTRAGMHRFPDALKDLDEAEKRKVSPDELAPSRAAIYQAIGRYDDAYAIEKRISDEHPSVQSEVLFASLVGDMGRRAEADRRFEGALSRFHDVTPFPVVLAFFQHGVFLEKSGETERAKALYRAAVERLPGYAHAASHLAGLSAEPDAVKLLEPLSNADDPEFRAMLGDLEQKAGTSAEAEALIDSAKSRYLELGRDHPEAFADHLARFFHGPGKDDALAAKWAQKNLELRKTPEAYELVLETAGKDQKLLCETAEAASTLKYAPGTLHLAAAKAFEACGKKDRAEAETKAARDLAVTR